MTLMRVFGVLLLFAVTPTVGQEDPRFRPAGVLPVGQADWISQDDGQLAFGAGTEVFLAEATANPTFADRILLEQPARQVVFAGKRLYLNGESGLAVLDLSPPGRGRGNADSRSPANRRPAHRPDG